jgi:GxxExxY protein
MFKEEGYKLMGAAFEVYNEIGYGMADEVYQQCLEIELHLRAIPFVPKRELTMRYKARKLETKYKPDLFVFEGIVVERTVKFPIVTVPAQSDDDGGGGGR